MAIELVSCHDPIWKVNVVLAKIQNNSELTIESVKNL